MGCNIRSVNKETVKNLAILQTCIGTPDLISISKRIIYITAYIFNLVDSLIDK